MKNVSLSKKIIFYILVTVVVNIVTLVFWFNFRIKPIFSEMNVLKEKLAKEEIKTYYPSTEALLVKLNAIAREYGVKFKLSDVDNKEVMQDNVKDELFLFSDIIEVSDNFYLLSVYMNKNVSTSGMITGLILFQIALVSIIMAFIFIFVRLKLISPVENIVKDIRNYKLGKKPKRSHVNGELGIIQNEFVNLVDSLENEKSEQNRIIASISHDIKTPLTSIIGYSDLIKDGNVSKKEIKEYNEIINSKAIHIKNILSDFDDYLINKSNTVLKMDKIYVKDIVKALNDDYKLDLKNDGIKLNIKCKCMNDVLTVDILKLKRIFANIISNSARFLDKNGVINIVITKDNKFFNFRISDNGPGVDDAIIDRIFDPLFTTDKSRKISGLGLSICKEFVLKLGGNIRAYNENGLVIEFNLPL